MTLTGAAWGANMLMAMFGGGMIGRLWPHTDDERKKAVDAGYDVTQVMTHDDLVRGNNCFFAATGVTGGELLRGVTYDPFGRDRRLPITHAWEE